VPSSEKLRVRLEVVEALGEGFDLAEELLARLRFLLFDAAGFAVPPLAAARAASMRAVAAFWAALRGFFFFAGRFVAVARLPLLRFGFIHAETVAPRSGQAKRGVCSSRACAAASTGARGRAPQR